MTMLHWRDGSTASRAPYEGGDVSRAAIWSLAAEEWRQAGQPARALESLQRAVEDGGEVSVDPGGRDRRHPVRARSARRGARGDQDDPRRGRRSPPPRSPSPRPWSPRVTCAAHEWATQGALASVAGSGEHTALLRARYRIRVDLGFPEDELDALLS